MMTISKIAAALLAAACFAVPAYAKPTPVVVQIAYTFKTPKGGEKVWVDQLQLNSAEAARTFCSTGVQKSAREAKYFTENYRELVGHSFVSASCVMKGGEVKMSNKLFSAWRVPDPAGIGMYYVEPSGKLKPTLFHDLRTPMSMSQCKDQLRKLTSQFKKNIKDNFRDFDGMKFAKSECVFVEGFKF